MIWIQARPSLRGAPACGLPRPYVLEVSFQVRSLSWRTSDWIRGFPAKCGRVWGQHPPNVHRNELVNFSKLVEQFFNEIKECALISQRALTDLVPARLDNVGALAH